EELQFFDDNGSYVSVVVEKNLRAIDLTQLLAVKNRVQKDYCWSIVEHWVEIGIERVLEDHEDVLSVHRQTEGGAKKYIFRRFPNKYNFFSKPEDYFPPDMIDSKTYLPGLVYPETHPEQLERVLTTAEELPVIFSQVNLRQESNVWVKTFLLLKESKILMSSKVQVVAKFLRAWRDSSSGYRPLEGETSIDQDDGLEQYISSITDGNEEDLEVLADLKDYEVYTSLNAKNQLKGPTEFGVVLRKTSEEDFAEPVVLSFDKGKDRVCWVTAMRLAKYGKQLRENYKAFKNKQETISTNGSSPTINDSVRSRVAMDFTGKVGRIVDDPMEAKAIAVSEGNAWKKRLRAKAESSRQVVAFSDK
ncbi:Growth factor receptor-bound protein, partial [Nesidiocoris tenuis]